jgi:hypothetical protein
MKQFVRLVFDTTWQNFFLRSWFGGSNPAACSDSGKSFCRAKMAW